MDGDGPLRQRDAIQHFADANDIQIVRWFEEAHTGSDLDGRVEFQQMRAELVSDGVRLVIVERLDRLARSIMVQETILSDFKKNDIELRSASKGEENLDSDDPTRTLIRQILGCFFEYERKMIVAKLRKARQRIRATGKKCEGRKAYGSRPGEELVLATIESLAQTATNTDEIAEYLNKHSVPTRYGKRWHGATVHKILFRLNRSTATLQKGA